MICLTGWDAHFSFQKQDNPPDLSGQMVNLLQLSWPIIPLRPLAIMVHQFLQPINFLGPSVPVAM